MSYVGQVPAERMAHLNVLLNRVKVATEQLINADNPAELAELQAVLVMASGAIVGRLLALKLIQPDQINDSIEAYLINFTNGIEIGHASVLEAAGKQIVAAIDPKAVN